jgi:hypothetical protein
MSPRTARRSAKEADQLYCVNRAVMNEQTYAWKWRANAGLPVRPLRLHLHTVADDCNDQCNTLHP